jgi:hypothetical protein
MIIVLVSGALLAFSDKPGVDSQVPKVKTRGPIIGILPMVDFEEQYYIEQEKIAAYFAALEAERIEREREVAEYLEGLYQAEQARLRQAANSARVQTPVRTQTPIVGGDCSGVAAVIGWGTVQHESGGNPLAENGIYKGCGQIGLPWWNGACAGLNWTNPADQATCAQIVMNLQGPSAWRGTYSP